jgi:hypothetical protein
MRDEVKKGKNERLVQTSVRRSSCREEEGEEGWEEEEK